MLRLAVCGIKRLTLNQPDSTPRMLLDLARRFWPVPPLLAVLLLTAAPYLGDHSTKLDFLGQFLIQTAAGTALLLIAFAAARRWLAGGLTLIAFGLQLAVLQPASWFPAHAGADAPQTVEVLFSNVWWHNQRVDEAAAQIRAWAPDIVVLAEIDERNRPILDTLAADYPYRVDCLQHWACDSAVLSRLPIVENLSAWNGKRRIATSVARIATPFGHLAVAGVHLDQPLPPRRVREQERQAEGLVELLSPIEDPLLLVGDFNAAPWGRLLRGLARDAGLEIAWGLEGTWPAALPWPLRIPIDHALTRNGFELVGREVVRMPGSDHKALRLLVGPSRTLAQRPAAPSPTL
jgi:endonuclease/exonuclease/phosphatase (EEP) superfamily protein YafD